MSHGMGAISAQGHCHQTLIKCMSIDSSLTRAEPSELEAVHRQFNVHLFDGLFIK